MTDSQDPAAHRESELVDAARLEVEQADETHASPGSGTSAPPPDSFTGYKIVREIHRGGQGVVYQAIQHSTKRKVAIKVMKHGPFAGAQDKARFDREVQVLGQLNHPHIVAIHDTGQAAGFHYFVMDYISGQSLDVYMAGGERSIEQTLKLFARIAEAVSAAHLRGIIHRDLKPGNIRIDNDGNSHILDFGLARTTGDQRSDMMTMTGQFIGSLPWASPEQAEGAPGKIDVRTDVYSLGVILYQMLTGRFPYEVVGNMRDVLDRIIKNEPARPSTIRRQINDEVETIVLKCLSKERDRRYQSAGELARDITRYLIGEPIDAKRDSAFYVIRKQLRRYKVPAGVGAAFVLLMAASLVVISIIAKQKSDLAISERDAKEQAIALQNEAMALRNEAIDARKDLEKERDAARWQTYLANIYAADTAIQANEIATARKRLEAAPSEFRDWEWNYLHAALNESITPALVQDGVKRRIIAISPDATRAITELLDGVHTIWDLDTAGPIAHFKREAELLEGRPLKFSTDGTRIVGMLNDHSVRIWDSATGELTKIPKLTPASYLWAALSPDRKRIVTAYRGSRAAVWDAATGKKLAILDGLAPWEISAAFSPDSSRIVTAQWDGMAHLWDSTTGAKLATLDATIHGSGAGFFSFQVQGASFSPDGTRIATVSTNHTACIWDAETGESLAVLRHDSHVRSAAFSPDGRHLVTTSTDKTARLWDIAAAEQLLVLRGHDDAVNTAAFSPDATRVVSASEDKTIRTWDATTGEQLAVYLGHEYEVYSVSFTPDGTRMVSASDHAAHIWDAMTNDHIRVVSADTSADGLGYTGIESVSFSPDGSRIVTKPYYSGEQARLWDAVTGEPLAVFPQLAGWPGLSFSPDGTRIVDTHNEHYSNSFDRFACVRVWDAVTGEQVAVIGEHDNMGRAAFSPDTARVVTPMGRNNRACVWDAATGEQLEILAGHEGHVYSASFNSDGTRIVSASTDDTARIWDASTGEELSILRWQERGPDGYLSSASFSPNGTEILAVSNDNTVRVWEVATGEPLFILRHDDEVHSAVFNPDGTRIVSASQDNTARIWDVTTGEQLLALRGHEVAVKSAAFTADGTRIMTGHDTTIRLWDTVAYERRHRQKQALERAEWKASRVLDVLLAAAPQRDGAVDLRAVADSIRTDSTLDEAVRHVALNLLTRRAGPIQVQAWDLIDRLQQHLVFAGDIRNAIRTEASIEPAVHAAAINIARWIEDGPGRLSDWASNVVEDDDRSPADYEQARRAAAAALQAHVPTEHYVSALAGAWTRLRKPDQAAEVWREYVEHLRAGPPTGDFDLPHALRQYAKTLLRNNQANDAEPVLRECLATYKNNAWLVQQTKKLLGECLTSLGKFPEAEEILIELAKSELADDTATKKNKTKAIQRVVDLYEAWHASAPDNGYDARARQWRERLPAEY